MSPIVTGKSLEYISQNSHSYTVKTETGEEMTIAKAWSGNEEDGLHHDFHQKWLTLSAIGLPLGGVLTVIFSPLVVWKNSNMLGTESLNKRERIHAKNFIITSVILFIFGLIFFGLFIMHLIY